MMHKISISFVPLNETHFGIIHEWFNKPHVQAFYSLRNWTYEDVCKKLSPYMRGEKQMSSFVVYMDNDPVGYIQSYPVKDHPWENQDLPPSIVQDAAGFDFFIGEVKYLGKGLGSEIVESFLK